MKKLTNLTQILSTKQIENRKMKLLSVFLFLIALSIAIKYGFFITSHAVSALVITSEKSHLKTNELCYNITILNKNNNPVFYRNFNGPEFIFIESNSKNNV